MVEARGGVGLWVMVDVLRMGPWDCGWVGPRGVRSLLVGEELAVLGEV